MLDRVLTRRRPGDLSWAGIQEMTDDADQRRAKTQGDNGSGHLWQTDDGAWIVLH